ncbi:conjugal transfer protein TraD [Rhizobium binxianense]
MKRSTTSEDRRRDTREKIELGGLVVKAGLRAEQRMLLLGLLIDGGRRVCNDEEERRRLAAIGAEACVHDDE